MKWIGQHIWDFISRFRNDVYLENIEAGTPNAFLSVDTDKKVIKGAIDASTTAKGVVELATTAETTTGTDTTKAVTPDGLKDGYQGSTNVTTLGDIANGAWRATPITTTYGGTNLSSYTQGDILYYNSGITLSKLGIGTAGQVLKVNSGATAPEWGTDAAGLSFNGSTSNGILTYGSSTQADVESQLKFSGTTLDVGTSADHIASLQFTNDENAFTIGVSNATNGGIVGTADGDVFINSTGDHNVCIGQNNTTDLKIDTDGDVVISNNLDVTGAITGNVTGNASGSSGSCTGNAATATALATARAINGVDFDGTAPITITAAGSTLSDPVTVEKGGTGVVSLAADSILTGNGTSGIVAEAFLTYSTSDEELIIGNPDAGDAIISRRDSSGTNTAGGNLIIQAGPATGNAAGGSVKFHSSTAGGSGSAIQSSNEVASIDKDGNLQVDGGITTGSTSFVNGSGVVQVATQGTIDHDSLANFVANEHIDWAGASAGTIHSTNIPTLNQDTTGNAVTATALATARAINGVDFNGTAPITVTAAGSTLSDTVPVSKGGTGSTTVASGHILRGNGTSAFTADTDLMFSGGNLNIQSDTSAKPLISVNSLNEDAEAPELQFIKGTVGSDGDDLGKITFEGFDPDGNQHTFAQALGEIVVAANGSEEGKLTLSVASHDAELQPGLIIASGDVEDEVDVTIGQKTTSLTTVNGSLKVSRNFIYSSVQVIQSAVKVTLSTANCNALHTTPIVLVPAQGANTVIVPIGGMIRVDRAATQSNSSSDVNFHYAGREPGTINQTALAHYRRFMYNDSGDRVFHIIPAMPYSEVSQNLTHDVDTALEISVDSAFTTNCFTSITVYLTYNVFDIS